MMILYILVSAKAVVHPHMIIFKNDNYLWPVREAPHHEVYTVLRVSSRRLDTSLSGIKQLSELRAVKS